MVVIYLTGITIAMFNITGIIFVLFMIFFSQQSSSKLKKANIKKSSTIKTNTNSGSAINTKDNSSLIKGKEENKFGSKIAGGLAVAAGVETLNNKNSTREFDNIDNILHDLDLSDFDDLDLDDFN